MSVASVAIHAILNWVFVTRLQLGVVGVALALDVAWWILVVGLFVYISCGGCPETWTGFSLEAFSGLVEFLQLSASSGVMLW